MRVLVAPQEFKGSLTAREAADAIARGLRAADRDLVIDTLPMADGGPGTVEVLVDATGGRFVDTEVSDPLGRRIVARWGELPSAAVIEMAAASGLALLAPDERDPRVTSTFGTGGLIRAALDAGHRRLIIGVGGSATNDAGAGMAQALGARLLDAAGDELPPGGAALARLDRIDATELDRRLQKTEVIVASDVTNPLCGPDGASLVYGPQKGASEAVGRELDVALAHFAGVLLRDLEIDVIGAPGAGAAGGLGAGLMAFCGATIQPGFDVVSEAVGLVERVRKADLVVTGEGRLDRQSAFGKTTAGMARVARRAGLPVVAIVGVAADDDVRSLFDAVFTLAPDLTSPEDAIERAPIVIAEAASKVVRWTGERAR